jgi:hypothetical protein
MLPFKFKFFRRFQVWQIINRPSKGPGKTRLEDSEIRITGPVTRTSLKKYGPPFPATQQIRPKRAFKKQFLSSRKALPKALFTRIRPPGKFPAWPARSISSHPTADV